MARALTGCAGAACATRHERALRPSGEDRRPEDGSALLGLSVAPLTSCYLPDAGEKYRLFVPCGGAVRTCRCLPRRRAVPSGRTAPPPDRGACAGIAPARACPPVVAGRASQHSRPTGRSTTEGARCSAERSNWHRPIAAGGCDQGPRHPGRAGGACRACRSGTWRTELTLTLPPWARTTSDQPQQGSGRRESNSSSQLWWLGGYRPRMCAEVRYS